MKHLAIISTPLQYLNLLELIDSISEVTYKNCVLLLVSPFKKSIEQIKAIGNTEHFARVYMPMVFSSSSLLNYLLAYFIFQSYRFRTPILGNLNNIFCQAALRTKKTPVVLDDGTGTIIIANKRTKNFFSIGERFSKSSSRMLRLMSFIYKPENEYNNPMIFYTSYKNLLFNRIDSIIINNYDFLKSSTYGNPKKEKVNECWFVGAPFVQLKMISQEKYNEIILSISSIYENRGLKFVYFPHRKESNFSTNSNYEIVNNDVPFELYYLNSHKLPFIVSSFYSSCLHTINSIDSQVIIEAFKLSDNILFFRNNIAKQNINEVYNYLKTQSNTQIYSDIY